MKKRKTLESKVFGKFSYLLTALLALLVGVALADDSRVSGTVLCLLFAAVLLAAISTSCRRHKTIRTGLSLAVPMLFSSVAAIYVRDSRVVGLTHDFLAISFFLFSSYHVLWAVLDDKRVTLDTIVGAICLYILMGLVWTYLYSVMQLVDASTFARAAAEGSEIPGMSPAEITGLQPLVYLSFVTMTTLGYGDLVPNSPLAQTACFLQAVFGQFFLAVLVARLVALYLASMAPQGALPRLR